MSLSYVNQLQAENIYVNNVSTIQFIILIIGVVEFLLLHIFIDLKKIQSFFLELHSSVQSQFTKSKNLKNPCQETNKDGTFGHCVSRGDLEVVFRRLGMFWNEEEEGQCNDIFTLFEVKNPNLDEVKDAFDVFDRNRDGFIDAEELQSVLCDLGFVEGLEMEKCKRMIDVLDQNEDGRMGFEKFAKFLEDSVCS